jgi:hypothetical protein
MEQWVDENLFLFKKMIYLIFITKGNHYKMCDEFTFLTSMLSLLDVQDPNIDSLYIMFKYLIENKQSKSNKNLKKIALSKLDSVIIQTCDPRFFKFYEELCGTQHPVEVALYNEHHSKL